MKVVHWLCVFLFVASPILANECSRKEYEAVKDKPDGFYFAFHQSIAGQNDSLRTEKVGVDYQNGVSRLFGDIPYDSKGKLIFLFKKTKNEKDEKDDKYLFKFALRNNDAILVTQKTTTRKGLPLNSVAEYVSVARKNNLVTECNNRGQAGFAAAHNLFKRSTYVNEHISGNIRSSAILRNNFHFDYIPAGKSECSNTFDEGQTRVKVNRDNTNNTLAEMFNDGDVEMLATARSASILDVFIAPAVASENPQTKTKNYESVTKTLVYLGHPKIAQNCISIAAPIVTRDVKVSGKEWQRFFAPRYRRLAIKAELFSEDSNRWKPDETEVVFEVMNNDKGNNSRIPPRKLIIGWE